MKQGVPVEASAETFADPAAARDVLELVALAPRAAQAPAPGALLRGVVARCDAAEAAAGPSLVRYEIHVEGGHLSAQQAESCVLRPERGDVVLVSVAPAQASYVLAVLERPGDAPRVWQAPRAESIKVSAETLDVEGTRAVGVRAPTLDVGAAKATMAFRAVTVTSEVVRGAADALEWVSRRMQTVADWSVHRAGTYVRSVAGADTVVAEHVVRTANQTMMSNATHSVLTAKEDVRVDAKRIHMG